MKKTIFGFIVSMLTVCYSSAHMCKKEYIHYFKSCSAAKSCHNLHQDLFNNDRIWMNCDTNSHQSTVNYIYCKSIDIAMKAHADILNCNGRLHMYSCY